MPSYEGRSGPLSMENMDTIVALRISYLLSAAAILVIYTVPALRNRFLLYGPRSQGQVVTRRPQVKQDKQDIQEKLLDYIASIRVPHSWFKHFYLLSVTSSMVWLQQIYTRGPLLQYLLRGTSKNDASMSFNQIVLCWALLLLHGSRRLYECIILAKPSRSEMWVGHYLLGLLYYVATGIAIWIEGGPALLSFEEPLGDVAIAAPGISYVLLLPVFLFASGIQFDTHAYLHSLRAYSLPSHPAFQQIISPHYTAECGIYLSLTFLATPHGRLLNRTLLTALTFVVIELGISADMTKHWYGQKFGEASVAHRRRMIPGIW